MAINGASPASPATNNPWAMAASPLRRVTLAFDALGDDADDCLANLSAAVAAGDALFLGGDEGATLERLTRTGEGWGEHVRLPLADCLEWDAEDEADIEGLAEDDGWLWVLGSHARTRPKLDRASGTIDLDDYAQLKDTSGRCVLARLPLGPDPDGTGVPRPLAVDGARRAGTLRRNAEGNALARRLKRDPLLKPFTRIAAKEGGVDLEGIAVACERVAIGMRGPVIQTHAVLLELTVKARRSGRLSIDGPIFVRILELEGLGIRDLKRDGDDLLILAGPTTGLDGPVSIWRWTDWLHDPPLDARVVRRHKPERVMDLPFGHGDDHPEGLALLDDSALLVVCDTPAKPRLRGGKNRLDCDVFALPEAAKPVALSAPAT